MKHGDFFSRGLSAKFIEKLLHGRFAGLLQAVIAEGLDVQIRENYIDVYHRGLAVLKLAEHSRPPEYRATIHRKFLSGVQLPDVVPRASGNYLHFAAAEEFAKRYVEHLPRILSNAEQYAGTEATVEEDMIRASKTANSPVVFIDRQVQAHGIRKKADLLGVTAAADRVVLVELKQGRDSRIQSLMGQIADYYHALTVPGGRLHEQVTDSCRRIVAQKKSLGLLPEHVMFPKTPPVVECLLVLYGYPLKSALLDRLRSAAGCNDFKTSLVLLPKGCCVLPPSSAWDVL
ncbi:MAG TPA: hypothetical protein ENN09_01675 [Planctomycetes bacterium]|nr:hypothetical protein [Planctomycetota bacterium]